MGRRSRHGLHLVRDGVPPAAHPPAQPPEDDRRRLSLSVHQQSVVLRIGGVLNADTAGRLRMFLTMFTIDGGPAELVLDLAAVHAVDEEGMAPIHEADEAMRLRLASLRLASVSAVVTCHLDEARCSRTLVVRPPLGPVRGAPTGEPTLPGDDPRAPGPGRPDR